jgi:hypothetical protein
MSKPLLRFTRINRQRNSDHSDVREILKITNRVERIPKTNKMKVKKQKQTIVHRWHSVSDEGDDKTWDDKNDDQETVLGFRGINLRLNHQHVSKLDGHLVNFFRCTHTHTHTHTHTRHFGR